MIFQIKTKLAAVYNYFIPLPTHQFAFQNHARLFIAGQRFYREKNAP